MATATNMNQLFINGAIEGFTDLVAPINAFSYAVKQTGAALNDVVRVPYVANASGSSAFSYASGYSGTSNGVTGKDITLNNLFYQPITITDGEMAQLSPEVITRLGRQAGARLASDVVSASFAAVISAANYPASSSVPYVAAAFTSSVALADLDKQANTLKWADGERYLIAGTTLWSSLMNNSTVVNAANFGSSEAVQQGKLTTVYGFTPYKTTVALPNSDTGFACTPNAVLLGMAPHIPSADAAAAGVTFIQATEEKTGLSITMKSYYDPQLSTTVKILECLFGVAKGDGNALIHIK